MRNPFQFGKVVRGKQFCNRVEELREIVNSLKSGNSLWIYSPRRIGKTSLVMNAFEKIKDTKTIYFDLYNIRNAQEFAEKYLNTITHELFGKKPSINTVLTKLTKLLSNIKPTISLDSMGNPTIGFDVKPNVIKESIESILNIPEQLNFKKPICIAFDEFQEINRIDPFFINIMRSVFQHQQNICYVFLGSQQTLMTKLFSERQSPFFEFGKKLNLKPISFGDLSSYIKAMFSDTDLPIKDETVQHILEISECHPHYTQYISSIVWDMIFQSVHQDETFQVKWENRVLEGLSDTFSIIYDQLNSNQRSLLYVISLRESQRLYAEDTRKRFDLPSKSTIKTSIDGLIQRSIILKDNNKYRFENPIFKLWIQKIFKA